MTSIQEATRRYEIARAAGDYAAAMDAAFSSEHIDKALNDAVSRDILAKKFPTRAAAIDHLDNLVFWGEPVPHVLALYIADLAQGKSRGGRPHKKPAAIAMDDQDLVALIGELAQSAVDAGASNTAALAAACERAANLFGQARRGSIPSELQSKESLTRLANRQVGRGDPGSIARAYYRAAARREGKPSRG